MTITICDMCKKQPKDEMINRWVRVAWTEGMTAVFVGEKEMKVELCGECYEALTRPLRDLLVNKEK